MLAVGDFAIHKGYLAPATQAAMAADVAAVAAAAPFFSPLTPFIEGPRHCGQFSAEITAVE